MFTMGVTVADAMAEGATLTAWCPRCRRQQVLWQPMSNRSLRADMRLTEVQARIRCSGCGGLGELWLSFMTSELVAYKFVQTFDCFNNVPYQE